MVLPFPLMKRHHHVLLISVTITAAASLLKISDAAFVPPLHTQQRQLHPQSVFIRQPLSGYDNKISPLKSKTTTTRLYYKLWERLQIEEDSEPFWYLINCVAGLEIDLLRQCREICANMPDAHKFVVPTEQKTRSHGANRMVTETKVKYQGYVFAKLRLCPEVYEAIQGLDLCRSWMGTVNHIGHKKLPPAPVALNELEVENFGLEDMEYEEEEEDEAVQRTPPGELDIILDEAGANDKKKQVDEEAIKAYLGLKVDDMVKVTKKCKFYEEDGIVRRLKDGKIFLRFYTYGSMFEEWMDPLDVRKLSDIEVLKGLQGPSQPITQQDLENPGKGDNRYGSDVRQGPGNFRGDLMSNVKGARGPRNRRQDRVQRGQAGDFFGRDGDESKREERNWDWYKENRRGKDGVVADDEWQYRPGSNNNRQNNDDWALSDSDSQWGRPPSQRQQRKDNNKKKQRSSNGGDWGKFVSPASPPAPSDEDDFFASLMTDLSKDLNVGDGGSGNKRAQQQASASDEPSRADSGSEEDDFFATLMQEIAPEAENEASKDESESSMYVDDFFSSLDVSPAEKSGEAESMFNEDDLFNSFDTDGSKQDTTSRSTDDIFDILDIDRNEDSSNSDDATFDDADDFFASLEQELGSALEERETSSSSLNDGDDDFFASLENELSSKLNTGDREESEIEDVPTGDSSSTTNASSKPKAKKSGGKSLNPVELETMKVPELKEMLRERGLKVSGKKAELIERLTE